ncbi:MAG: PAS domain S-box protein [Nodosilinea sp. WJT8-NPBG4]|nr:PAS domain S-box protein [Nodosilinea sp. WJT8-NPBG4]
MPDKPFGGGDEIETLLRSHDWSQTPLGAVETWSDSLKTVVQSRLAELNQAQGSEPMLAASVPLRNYTQTAPLHQAAQANTFRVTLADALRPLTDANEIQATAARILGERLGASRVIYAEVLPGDKDVIVHKNYTNGVAELIGRYRLDEFGRNLTDDHRAGKTAIVPDVANSLKYTDPEKAMYQAIDIAAHLDVPLIKNDQFVALLAVHQATPREWTEREVKWVEETAEQTWATVERARAEAALRESEAKYRTLFESIDQGLCICELLFDENGDPHDYRFLDVNLAFERLTGLEQVSGKTARQVVPNHDTHWFEIFGRVVRTGEPVRIKEQTSAINRWFDVNAFCVGTPQSHQFAALFTNITGAKRIEAERKQAEATLQQTSDELERQVRKFDATLSTITDVVFTFDRDGRFLYANQVLLDLWGVTAAEAIGKTMADLNYSPDVERQVLDDLQQVLETGKSVRNETPYISPTGVEGYFEYILSPVIAADHTAESVVGLSRDVSDRKRAEELLRQSESHLRLMIESAKDYAIFTLDLNGIVTKWNAGAERLLQYSEAEIIGHKNRIIFIPEDRQQGRAEQELQIALTQGRAENERWHLRKDSSRFWGSGLVMPLQDETGNVQGFVKIMQDKTAQRQAEAEREQLLQREQTARETAERANQIKDEFLAVLSHELRSPLNPILGWTQLLQTGRFDPARQAEALATIERNAKLQSQLIEDLLDISRIMQGKLTLNPTSTSLTFVISAALETVRLAAEAKNIALSLDLDPQIAPVFGDAGRLQQVVWNLLTNAVKFTPKGGQVTVELRQVDQLAQIRVMDSGIGIDAQFIPYVFEYFRQKDGSTTRRFGGLGLGLAIVRQIVELHGGTVAAESGGEQQGATFIVQLPVLKQSTPILPESTQPQLNSETLLENVQILLVDDDTDTREFQAFLLKQYGATVTAVASGLEALQALEQLIPDGIVSDVGMPEMDGYSLMQQIRSRPPAQGGMVPALALTAYAAEIDQKRALDVGFQAHLTKPLEPERFVSEIVTLLKPN